MRDKTIAINKRYKSVASSIERLGAPHKRLNKAHNLHDSTADAKCCCQAGTESGDL